MWKLFGVTANTRTYIIEGVNVWDHEWVDVQGETASIHDPDYGQPYTFPVYEVTENQHTVKFAAGEFSNSVYGFYVPGEVL